MTKIWPGVRDRQAYTTIYTLWSGINLPPYHPRYLIISIKEMNDVAASTRPPSCPLVPPSRSFGRRGSATIHFTQRRGGCVDIAQREVVGGGGEGWVDTP